MSFYVYFGGTFNPPHLGHDLILRTLLKDPLVEKVFLVPTGQNPLKENLTPGTTLELRKQVILSWVEGLQKEVAPEKLVLYDSELNTAHPSYTVDTLADLQKKYPHQKWALCLGADAFSNLEKWKEPQKLSSLLHSFWIFAREPEAPIPTDFKTLKLRPIRILSTKIPDISSTEIRKQLDTLNTEFIHELQIPTSVKVQLLAQRAKLPT